ncbi:MAG: quinone-dependent dihydroorotate dehydrogenase [Propionibacteriaceae bacterium]|jgi:dihydroorotate dehydrogenase|nr:quinone-dependent dihydroorotate dehydrogenase [Propionibacteriaceae bacterium]
MAIRTKIVSGGYTRLLRPLLFRAAHGDPEVIHTRMIKALGGPGSWWPTRALLRLLIPQRGKPTTVAGIDFPSRIGLAAGMDKDGLAVKAWAALGFGFAELGTVTAQAQPGNEKPRVFRLVSASALINRMGFNNDGAPALAARLAKRGVYRGNGKAGLPVGISIGKTKVVPLAEAIPDYLASLEAVLPHADYVAINVSSPNTPNLRELQGEGLRDLVQALIARAAQADVNPTPLFIKIAPDLSWAEIDAILAVAEELGAAGIIATNTTVSRDRLHPAHESHDYGPGGLSGRPLTRRAREVAGYVTAKTSLPVIGSGGIMNTDDAQAMFDVGAALIQLYTGFIYSGPGLALRINAIEKG